MRRNTVIHDGKIWCPAKLSTFVTHLIISKTLLYLHDDGNNDDDDDGGGNVFIEVGGIFYDYL